MSKKVSRLYEQFSPKHYNLELVIDPVKMTFTGRVEITGSRSGKPSKRITFHQKDLKITSATITKHQKNEDQSLTVVRINNQKSLDEVRIHSDQLIVAGEYTVAMEFDGHITDPMNGIYPCYFKHDGENKKLIATQFESHHAREAFPCIDEPEAKAKFDLKITSPINQTVLGNTPIKQQETSENEIITTFETTPKMSSYLLAFVIGDLDHAESRATNDVIVRSYATPDQKDKLAFSVDVAVKVLDFFENYFGVKYPLPKLDMVALPDFSSGAMENWGLITYRESAMLIDDSSSSIESKQHVALVIAHEISHQWFGNLVTMKWWDDLWLNESFANMMEYRAIDEIFPEWKIFETFVGHEGLAAKRRDSLKDVQPVHCQVNHPDEISTLFDPAIVYAKGGTLLYMLMNYLGEDSFRKGLKEYFQEHRYNNTVADDLWRALSDASKKNVSDVMKNWLTKPGYPLLITDWQPGSKTLKLEQKRLLAHNVESRDDTIWNVPLASNIPLGVEEINSQQATIGIDSGKDSALILNDGGKSYFVPQYVNQQHRNLIVKDIQDNKISAINRLLLIDNLNLLQKSSLANITELLDLISAFQNEKSETVWGAISIAIAEIRRLVELQSTEEEKIDKLVLALANKLVKELGWKDNKNDTAQVLQLRGLIYSMAISAKDQQLIGEGLEIFNNFKKPSDLDASTRSVVYLTVSRHGDDKQFNKLMELYSADLSAEEKEEVAAALCATHDRERYEKLIDILKTDVIRRQNLMSWFASLLRNRHSRQATWNWLTANWDWVEKTFASDKSFGYFARIAGSVFSDAQELTAFREFFDNKKNIVALTRDIKLADQEISNRVYWRENNQESARKWLMQH